MCPNSCGRTSFELSPKDKAILELNHKGYSSRQISKHLKSDYDIELGFSSVSDRLNELAMDPDNYVLNKHKYHGLRKPKEKGKWYQVILRLKKEIKEYEKLFGFKPDSRTMVYQFMDEGLIKKGDKHAFIRATVGARLGMINLDGTLKYPKLDLDCFADDDQRKEIGEFDVCRPYAPTRPTPPEDPDEYINDAIRLLKRAPYRYDGEGTPGSRGVPGGRWYGQPEYVEVWEEKNGLLPGFYELIGHLKVKIKANKGFSSLVFLNMCCEELKPLVERYGVEHIHIKYCGDWDASGEYMDYYIQKRLRQLGIQGVHFERVAVRQEHITKYNLPLMPVEKKEGAEKDDPNLKEFERRYGKSMTHLNAFFTKKHIGDFKKIITDSIKQHYNQSIYDEMVEQYNVDPEEPESYSEDTLLEIKQDMITKITEAFKPGWHNDLPNRDND
ncbi:MAG: hypothetical protein ACRD8W_03405 [Nitrososphaeraceae archaeon]